MSEPWIIGQVARISVAITDAVDVAADPGGLTLKIKPPAGAVVSHAYGAGVVLKDATGAYHADITLDQAGQYRWRWEASAPNVGADQGFLHVEASLL